MTVEPETNIPIEFTAKDVEAKSPKEAQLYVDFLRSGEPYRSLLRSDYHHSARLGYGYLRQQVPTDSAVPGLDLEDDALYYNTAGSAAEYWRQFDLPRPMKELQQLRSDLTEWGYCLISEALSPEQLSQMKKRLYDQASGERLAGIACWTGAMPPPGEALPHCQFVHSLINKGEQFVQCVEHDPRGVQAGPLIEQLLNETMGRDFLMSSFISIITHKHNLPQPLHQDQAIAPFQDPKAPFTVNTMYIVDDMCEHNGGTLVIPGSHRLLSNAASGEPLCAPMPPAINLEAPGGTVMIFEGRLLHGSGVNKSESTRAMCVMNSIKPFMRQQELHLLSADRELLKNASSKLLYRLGARPTGLGGIEGAWQGEYLVDQRLALERGSYRPVGELSPESSVDELEQAFSVRFAETTRAQAPHQPETLAEVRDAFADAQPHWQPPEGKRFPR